MEQIKKEQFYYVFCESTQEEYLTLEPFKTKYKKGHSMGTFLSEIAGILPFLTMISNIDETGFIESYYESLPYRNELYHRLGRNQESIKMFVNCLKNCLSMNNIDELESEISRITSYDIFIDLCLEHPKQHCNLHSFYKFTSLINDTLKICEKIMIIPEYFPDGALHFNSSDDLHNLLTTGNIKQNSQLGYYAKAGKLLKDNVKIFTNKNLKNFYKTMNTHVRQRKKELKGEFYHFYTINSITDIISASLQSIFGVKCVIKECELCNRIFVPKRSDARFCDKISLKYDNTKTCKEFQRAEKESERQNRNKHMKIYRSRKNSIDNSKYISNEKSKEFERISNDYFRQINEKSQNEQDKAELNCIIAEFIAWLDTQFIREGKTHYQALPFKPRKKSKHK